MKEFWKGLGAFLLFCGFVIALFFAFMFFIGMIVTFGFFATLGLLASFGVTVWLVVFMIKSLKAWRIMRTGGPRTVGEKLFLFPQACRGCGNTRLEVTESVEDRVDTSSGWTQGGQEGLTLDFYYSTVIESRICLQCGSQSTKQLREISWGTNGFGKPKPKPQRVHIFEALSPYFGV